MNTVTQDLIDDFTQVAALAGVSLPREALEGEVLPASHRRPARLPVRKMAVYAFVCREKCLKVGKAGPKSASRFASQHYNPGSSRNNLAKSILRHRSVLKRTLPASMHDRIDRLTEATVGEWIEHETARYHVFVSADLDDCVWSLLEVFVQCRLRPLFEGHAT